MRALWSSRDGSRRAWARERALAVGRHRTASLWRFVGGPRRARTGWRRVARSSGLGWPVWANQVGGDLAGWAARGRRLCPAGRETGEGRESREGREKERKKNLIEFKFESSSKFSNNTRKFLNMKDVPKFQNLPLLFQAYFHLGPNSKVQFESRQM